MTDPVDKTSVYASALTDAEVLDYIASHPDICLQYRKEDGTMDIDGVREEMRKTRKAKILDNYIDKIGKLNGKNDKRYYIHIKDETRKEGRITLKAPTKEELLDKIYEWHMSYYNGELAAARKEITLAKLFPEFLEYKKATTWSESTLNRNLYIWRRHYEGTKILNVPIRKIKLKTLQEWAYGLIREHDLTQKEFANVCTWMKQMFEYAEQEEIIDRNPYRFLKITNMNVFRQPEEKPDENKVLAPDMEMALYRKCWELYEDNHYPVNRSIPLAIILLFQAGLRPCEVCSLRYTDIKDGELVVKRYYSEKEDVVRENRTKAGHGPRRVPLTRLATELIARLHQDREEDSEKEYIFVNNEDQLKGYYNRMRKTFPLLCKDLDIPANTLYSGRRTFVSSLIDSQMNIRTIQNYVGHKDAKTTLNHYTYDRFGKEHRLKQLEQARLSVSVDDLVQAEKPGYSQTGADDKTDEHVDITASEALHELSGSVPNVPIPEAI